MSNSSADLFSHGRQHEQKGLVGEVKLVLSVITKNSDIMTFGRQKTPYSIDNKLDQLSDKIFNTIFVITMHTLVIISD